MAQAVTKLPSTHNQALPLTTAALIAGLSIPMLHGAGWIRLSYSGTINQAYAGKASIYLIPHLDGQPIPDAETLITGLQDAFLQFSRSILLKPGSGQHTYELYGYADQSGPTLWIGNTNFSIEEIGF